MILKNGEILPFGGKICLKRIRGYDTGEDERGSRQ